MGFIVGCFLLAMIGKGIWDVLFRKVERQKLLDEYRKSPIGSIFVLVWMMFFVMFFVGVFVPIFGQMNISDDGWQVWEIGILGFFGMWVLTWFIDVEKMDQNDQSAGCAPAAERYST